MTNKMEVVHVCRYRITKNNETGIFMLMDIKLGISFNISEDDYNYILDNLSGDACDLVWRYNMRISVV